MLRQKHHHHSDEEDNLLDPDSGEEEYRHRGRRDAPESSVRSANVASRDPPKMPVGNQSVQNAVPYNKPTQLYSEPPEQYNQPFGYAHPYHPPPQYNSPPPPPFQSHRGFNFNLSGGIHYSYLILIALTFATVVQISKGGLFAYNANQRQQFVYPVPMQNPNVRFPNGYYMGNGNGNMMNGMNAQQGQASTSAVSDQEPAANESSASPEPASPEPASPEPAASTPVDSSTSSSSGGGSGSVSNLDALSNFKDNWDEWEPSDTPVFFHIPKAGGSTIKDIIGTCHRFYMATEAGITDGHDKDTEIAIVYPGGGPKGVDRSPFINVDTTTVAGIARAKEMGFADSGLADAVVTPFIYEANELFTPTAKGRLFTVFRHPIDRAISLFYYLQVADWEPTYDPELQNWSIKEYATSDRIENNWLTRQLSNQLGGELHDENLEIAMEVVRSKFLVGLMSEIKTTMERCERFYHWTYHVNPPNQEKCREALLKGGSNSNSKNKKDKPQPGSEEWELLAWQNNYDIQLYEYIETLFVEQEQFVADIPKDFRNIDGTCCKCDPPTFPPEGFECPKAILF